MDLAHHLVAVGGLHVAQVDLALRPGRDGVHALPARDQADIQGDAALQIGQRMDGGDLRRQFADGADPGLEIAAGMGRLALDVEDREDAALAPVTTPPLGRPGSELNTTRASRAVGLDHLAPLRAADLLVAGEQAEQRPGRAAELLEGGQDEHVHHQPRLHVGDAGAGGDAVLDAEGAAGGLALREDRVAMAHHDDGLLRVAAAERLAALDSGLQAVAMLLARHHLHRDALLRHEVLDDAPTASTPGLS